MPRYDSATKRLVRARMLRTGERYTDARAAIVRQRRLGFVVTWDPLMATLPIGVVNDDAIEAS